MSFSPSAGHGTPPPLDRSNPWTVRVDVCGSCCLSSSFSSFLISSFYVNHSRTFRVCECLGAIRREGDGDRGTQKEVK